MSKSYEQKQAEKLNDLMKDSTLDLEQVGMYLGRGRPSYLLTRLDLVVDTAKAERDLEIEKATNTPTFY